jgi:hypothetical protein
MNKGNLQFPLVGKRDKRGYFYSLDAFLALLIIFAVILFIKPPSSQVHYHSEIQEDILIVLSNLKIGEINNTYVDTLKLNGDITNLDQSVLEQIGEFYANSSPKADILAQNILDELALRENIGIYFNKKKIANSSSINLGDAKTVSTSRQIISGIHNGTAAKGFYSRAYLFAENRVDYFYFGGYVGDGNITVRLDGKVIGAKIEGVFSRNFDFYINEQYTSHHIPNADIPYTFDLSQNLSYFVDGANNISFKSSENMYIAGGYLKVVYNETQAPASFNKKYFPGIDGLINIYDSFYVPGQLDSMKVFLHYNSSFDIFMTIGDTEIYKGNSSGVETSITFDNSTLSSNLTYANLSNKTIPYRLGLYNVSYAINITQDADVFSVTDLSGSMAGACVGADGACCDSYDCDENATVCEVCDGTYFSRCWFEDRECCILFTCDDNETTCESCGGVPTGKIFSAKEANRIFIDAVLNSSGNRVGLVGYETTVRESAFHQLSDDASSLKSKVNEWYDNGWTCICCGINKAVDKLVNDSSPDKYRSMVVMTDGHANYECTPHRYSTTQAPLDAIQAACDAYDNYSIVTHAVGFGSDADETTLQNIASCGHGDYHYGDVDDLVGIYEQIAEAIINASYYEQTIIAENVSTKLYPDSYIEIDYVRDIPPGMIIVSETEEFGNNISQGSFFVPDDSEVYEVQAISYSGSKWTSLVEINDTGSWNTVFNISKYNASFVELGDPYAVNIPPELVEYGNNTVKIQVGLSPASLSGGSSHNKIIYSLVKNISGFSPILPSVEGCTWHIEFEDGTAESIDVPENYGGTDDCYYNSTISDPSHVYLPNNNDALEYAIYLLLSNLDLNDNGKIETKFTEQDLSITSIEVEGIPFTWETEVQARVWI